MENNQIEKPKYSFKKFIDFLKEYLGVLILIPTVLGGLWQFFELATMSISFVRFFSITQIIPDGLMLLFLLLIISVITVPFTRFMFIIKEMHFKTFLITELNFIKIGRYVSTIAIVIIVVDIYLLYNYLSKVEDTITLLLIFLPLHILSTTVPFIIVTKSFKLNDEASMKHFMGMYFNMFLLNALSYSFFLLEIHNRYILPQNLKNLELAIQNKQDLVKDKTLTVLYANDKYIFISLENKLPESKIKKEWNDFLKIEKKHSKDDFLILKFDELFELNKEDFSNPEKKIKIKYGR